MLGPSYYYVVIQSRDQTFINLACYYGFMVVLIIALCVIYCDRKIHYRLLKLKKKCLVFKWVSWLLELVLFPLLLNIIQFSVC